jgi:hypothetical protein
MDHDRPVMPSATHEALVELIRRRPTLTEELTRDLLDSPQPPLPHIQIGDTTLTDPPAPAERKADLVLLLSDTPGGTPRRAVVVEVQLAIDPEKRWSWPSYVVAVHARHRCDVMLVVVTPRASVAGWARKPLLLGPPNGAIQPVVIGPASVPVIKDQAEALQAPELAVLSAIMHGKSKGGEDIAKAALAAASVLDDRAANLYTDIILLSLRASARAVIEELMGNGTYQYQSDFAKRYYGQGRAEGEALGRAEGEALGRAEGEALGRAAGEALGRALLALLDARRIAVPPQVRDRVLGCTDVPTLDEWIVRAATANAIADVITD